MNTDDKNKTHTEPELEIVVPADDTLTEETDSTKDETNAPTDEPQLRFIFTPDNKAQ